MSGVRIDATDGGIVLRIRAQPRASRTEVAGPYGEMVKVRIAAPPVDGAANDELVDFLAETLGVSRAAVELVGGHGGRSKRVRVLGVDAARARKALGL